MGERDMLRIDQALFPWVRDSVAHRPGPLPMGETCSTDSYPGMLERRNMQHRQLPGHARKGEHAAHTATWAC